MDEMCLPQTQAHRSPSNATHPPKAIRRHCPEAAGEAAGILGHSPASSATPASLCSGGCRLCRTFGGTARGHAPRRSPLSGSACGPGWARRPAGEALPVETNHSSVSVAGRSPKRTVRGFQPETRAPRRCLDTPTGGDGDLRQHRVFIPSCHDRGFDGRMNPGRNGCMPVTHLIQEDLRRRLTPSARQTTKQPLP